MKLHAPSYLKFKPLALGTALVGYVILLALFLAAGMPITQPAPKCVSAVSSPAELMTILHKLAELVLLTCCTALVGYVSLLARFLVLACPSRSLRPRSAIAWLRQPLQLAFKSSKLFAVL